MNKDEVMKIVTEIVQKSPNGMNSDDVIKIMSLSAGLIGTGALFTLAIQNSKDIVGWFNDLFARIEKVEVNKPNGSSISANFTKK